MLSHSNYRWLGFRLEVLGAFIIFSAAMFAVLSRGSVSGGIVGLSITYALQVILLFLFGHTYKLEVCGFVRLDVRRWMLDVARLSEHVLTWASSVMGHGNTYLHRLFALF